MVFIFFKQIQVIPITIKATTKKIFYKTYKTGQNPVFSGKLLMEVIK